MSGKLHHGHSDVEAKGATFRIAHEGDYEGKIVEVDSHGEYVKPFDFSITKNIASLFFGVIILLWVFLSIAKRYKQHPDSAPKGLQSFFEPIILFIRDDVAKPSIGHRYNAFMPYLLTLFFFIWFNNMLGLIPIIPGGANLTGNIAITLVLAFFTFIITNFAGNKNYWTHIFNMPGVPWWLKLPVPLMPVIEFFGVLTKPIVLMIRLFANITAGTGVGITNTPGGIEISSSVQEITSDPAGTFNIGNLPAGSTYTSNAINAFIVDFGDIIIGSVDVNLQGCMLTAYVSQPNVIRVSIFNGTGGTVNLGTVNVRVMIVN
jgi:F0F1-type ATP synthase membrane subunit a